jgi:hypothetical protein
VSYLEKCVVGLNPDARERVRGWLCQVGEIAVDRADVPAARFVDRRLAELDSRQVDPDGEPLLGEGWRQVWRDLLANIRDGEPSYSEDTRDWANGVLTLLDDMRMYPDMFR